MNTHLQISVLLYVLLIAVIYFHKKKINTIENIVFKSLIIHTICTIIIDLTSRIYAIYKPMTYLTVLIFKTNLWMLVSYIIIFTYYVYCISTKLNKGNIPWDENENKKHFQKGLLSMYLAMLLAYPIMLYLPVYLSVGGNYFTQTGPAMSAAYILSAIFIILWLVFIFKNKTNWKNKKFIPIYIFCIISLIAVILQHVKPEICFITPSIGIITVLVFFTLENPDLHMIEQLNITKEEAVKANEAKTEFLSSMSHEIRTPLNAIIGFSQALSKEDISGTAKEEVQDILTASNNLLEIVNGILDISKIEANSIEIMNVDYSTKKLIKDTCSLINARIGSKVIEFKTEIDDKLPPVLYGDCTRVKQIIINLLTNAVKYTDEGYIKLSIKSRKRNNNCRLVIMVEDSGIGMTKEDLEMLFTKFQRFDMSKNANVEGTGLGMVITKGLVELMNGTIDVKSEYKKGSIFTVEIDQKISSKRLEEIEKEEKVGKVEPFNASGQKILVVDDNKINLKVAERLLREYNVSVELVISGPECINRILEGKKYDLIFLDIMMPKMKGPEVLQNLKNIIGFKTPVVALTADVISGMEEKYIKEGFDDCLAKPIVEEELYYILKKYLKENKNKTKEITSKDLLKNDKNNLKILEENGVNVKQGLELLKDIEMYKMTLNEFYEELDEKISQLNDYRKNKDLDSYSILAHSLKTEARYLGFNDLADMAYEHELASKENNQEFVNSNYSVLKMESIRIYDLIKKYLEGEK